MASDQTAYKKGGIPRARTISAWGHSQNKVDMASLA
jgi:hypothetical protein